MLVAQNGRAAHTDILWAVHGAALACATPPGVRLTQVNSATTSTSLRLNLRPATTSTAGLRAYASAFPRALAQPGAAAIAAAVITHAGDTQLALHVLRLFCNLIFVMLKNVRTRRLSPVSGSQDGWDVLPPQGHLGHVVEDRVA